MSDNIFELYNRFKHILSGCRTILDAFFFADKFIKKHPDMNELVNSMIQGKQYDTVMDFRTVKNTLIDLDTYMYREDIDECIDKITRNGADTIQTKALLRLSKMKPMRPLKIETTKFYELKKDTTNLRTNECPHCKKKCTIASDTNYIICGYSDTHTGYDWEGCGKDWCFTCGKMLCKTWDQNQLFIDINRIHDSVCCLEHSKKTGHSYPTEYCCCINNHVQRLITIDNFMS
jgi:hypothetical protein